MPLASRIWKIPSWSRAVTTNSHSCSSSLIRGAKKFAWKGVLIAIQILLIFFGSDFALLAMVLFSLFQFFFLHHNSNHKGKNGVDSFHQEQSFNEAALGHKVHSHEGVRKC